MALIFDEVRSLNRLLDEGKSDGASSRVAALKRMVEILGLLQDEPQAFFERKKRRWLRLQGLSPEVIEGLVQKRDQARREKRWQEADKIRVQLQEKGITLEDTAGGTVWRVR